TPWLITGDLKNVSIAGVTKRQQAWPKIRRGSTHHTSLPTKRAFAYTATKQGPFFGIGKNEHIDNWKWGKLDKSTKRKGAQDLDAWFAARYDKEHLYLLINVTDNKHYQP